MPSMLSPASPKEAVPANEGSVVAIGNKLIEKKLADHVWDEKTARQAQMIFDLFDRFLAEDAAVAILSELRQRHLDAFERFLRVLHKTYGKSPKDKARTIIELRRESERRPSAERGLSGASRNRHLTFVGQLLRRAKSAAGHMAPYRAAPSPNIRVISDRFCVPQAQSGLSASTSVIPNGVTV